MPDSHPRQPVSLLIEPPKAAMAAWSAALAKGYTNWQLMRLLSVSGSLDKTDRNELRLWDAETGEELRRIRQRPAPYVSLDATPDGAVWIAGTTEGVVEVWERVE